SVSLRAQDRRCAGSLLEGRAERRRGEARRKQTSCWTEETGSSHGRAEGVIRCDWRRNGSDEWNGREREGKKKRQVKVCFQCSCPTVTFSFFGVGLVFGESLRTVGRVADSATLAVSPASASVIVYIWGYDALKEK